MENSYLDLLRDVLANGSRRGDRTGTGTISVFGRQLRCNLADGFPALTTKKLFWKPVAGELLWFLEGSQDTSRLAEITFGDSTRQTIWTGNTEAPYWKPKADFVGDAGRIYGVQWRNWRNTKVLSYQDKVEHVDNATTVFKAKVQTQEYDQIAKIIDTIKTNPTDRRMVLTAFNVGEMDQMSLPPCHMFAQFYVNFLDDGSKTLSCQVYMRSVDTFLGLPFNIASYALLTHMIAQVTGLGVGELVMSLGDVHIYSNHIDAVNEQLARAPMTMPTLYLNPAIDNIDKFTMVDIELRGYESHPSIRAEMAV